MNPIEKRILFYGLLFAIPILLTSAPISIPVSFADGNVLTAAQLNQNFSALLGKINELDLAITNLTDKVNNSGSGNLLYPDGTEGEAVIIPPTTSYKVPDGKTLYITSYASNGVWINNSLDNSTIDGYDPTFTLNPVPIIVKEGNTVMKSANSITGILVKKKVEIVNRIIRNNEGYQVPIGKSLYITSYTCNLTTSFNGIGFTVAYLYNSLDTRPKYLTTLPVIIKEGLVLNNSISNSICSIIGYLK